jgi:hypothetical protein
MQWTIDETARPPLHQDLTPNSDAAHLRLDPPSLIAMLALCHESPSTSRRPDHPLASAISATHQLPSSSTKTGKHRASPDREQWLLPSIALCSLIYSLHERLSDPSSLVAWSWSGFPINYRRTHVPPREGMGGPDRVLVRRRESGHSPLRMNSFQVHGAFVNARTCKLTLPFTTSLTVTDNRGHSIFATRVLVAQLTLIVARRHIRIALALIAVVALIGPLRKSAQMAPTPAPAHARVRILNAGIWTVHFGIDNAGRDSQRSM